MDPGRTSEERTAEAPHRFAPRWQRNLAIGVIVWTIVSANIAAAFAPTLIVNHPLAMLAFNSSNRYLFLVTNQLSAPAFYSVAFLRRIAPALAFFFIGRWYGRRAIHWIEHRDPSAKRLVKSAEKFFGKSSWAMLALFPMSIIALLAGAERLPRGRAVAVMSVSIAARLVLYRMLGKAIADPMQSVVNWISRWRLPLLGITITFVALSLFSQRKSRIESLEELTSLDEEPEPVE